MVWSLNDFISRKIKKLLLQEPTNTMVSERSQAQVSAYCVTSFMQNSKTNRVRIVVN